MYEGVSVTKVKSDELTINRRASSDRRDNDRRKKDMPVENDRRTVERRVKPARRRQIDPTTCERDYSIEEVEFMSALEKYKRSSGRMFPTCSEILEVIRGLGYVRPQTTGEIPTLMASSVAVLAMNLPAVSSADFVGGV